MFVSACFVDSVSSFLIVCLMSLSWKRFLPDLQRKGGSEVDGGKEREEGKGRKRGKRKRKVASGS